MLDLTLTDPTLKFMFLYVFGHDDITCQEPPKAGVIREGQTMWMGGGGGTYWVVDRVHSTVAVSFSQSFGGRGHSTDAAKDENCGAAV
jgi:CubicO group peptidase (beta-lactamase class C family)